MHEILSQDKTLFTESVKNYQKLVDILIESKNEDEISAISYSDIAEIMGYSQTWVRKAMKRLNTEDACIKMIATAKYVVNYTNILLKGVFFEISKLIIEFCMVPELILKKEAEIAAEQGISLKTIQMLKSYHLWKHVSHTPHQLPYSSKKRAKVS